jgi:hypothetical protein
MDVKLFIEYLPWLRKPKYYYTSKGGLDGWDKDEIEKALAWRIENTTPIKRAAVLSLPDAPAELQALFAEHDLSSIDMLWTTFWSEPKRLSEGWGFADMSETNIVVAPSGRIEAYNAHPIRGMPGATDCLGMLAEDLESYLEAMLYGQMNATHFISGDPNEDPILYQKTVLVAKHCALIAGGYEYYDFWAGVLGLPRTEKVPE